MRAWVAGRAGSSPGRRERRRTGPRPLRGAPRRAHHGRRDRGGGAAWALLAAALLSPAAAGAQVLDVEAGTGIVRSGPETTAAAAIFAPALAVASGGSVLRLGGQLAGVTSGGVAAELSGAGAWFHPVRAGLGLGARLEGRWSAFPAAADVGEARATLGTRLGGPDRGAAAVVGAARYRAPTRSQTALQGELTAWTVLGRLRLRASATVSSFKEPLTAFRDPIVAPPDSSVPRPDPPIARAARSRRYTDAELGAEWRPGRLTLQLVGGARLGDAADVAEMWGSAAAAYALRQGIALTAAAGVLPARIERGLGRAPFGRIGLRFGLPAGPDRAHAVPAAPAPSLVARDVGGGYAVLRARVPGAQRVEIKGDFTDWKPVELAAAGAGTWEARLRVAPGVYRVNLRVDGGPWIAPPGLPSVVDEFDGVAGILVVE